MSAASASEDAGLRYRRHRTLVFLSSGALPTALNCTLSLSSAEGGAESDGGGSAESGGAGELICATEAVKSVKHAAFATRFCLVSL